MLSSIAAHPNLSGNTLHLYFSFSFYLLHYHKVSLHKTVLNCRTSSPSVHLMWKLSLYLYE